ncbi:MAG: HAMP domain-containing protein [Anaerolineae bacterium]
MTAIKHAARGLVYRLFSIRISLKILGLALGLIFLLGIGLTLQMQVIQEQTLRRELTQHGISLTRDLSAQSADLILLDDLYSLYNLLTEIQRNNPTTRYVFILDERGEPIVHSFTDGFPRGLIEANTVLPSERYHLQAVQSDEGTIWDIAVPILAGEAGTARLGVSEASLWQTVEATTRQFLFTTAAVGVLGGVLALVLTWMMTRPINRLAQAAQAVSTGDLSQQVPVFGEDEIGQLTRTFNQMTVDLAHAAHEREERDLLRAMLLDKIITAQEEERRRIARELHDDTGQALTAIKMGLTNAINTCGRCRERGRLDELYDLTGATLDGVRHLALELRPPVLDDLGLVPAIRRYIQDWARTYGIQISFEAVGMENIRLPRSVETAMYRIVQEALTNVARHAQANHVDVVLEKRGQQCVAVIEDDGVGFSCEALEDNQQHLGLSGMKERAQLVNGRVVIESAPGQGTTVFVQVPLMVSESADVLGVNT